MIADKIRAENYCFFPTLAEEEAFMLGYEVAAQIAEENSGWIKVAPMDDPIFESDDLAHVLWGAWCQLPKGMVWVTDTDPTGFPGPLYYTILPQPPEAGE